MGLGSTVAPGAKDDFKGNLKATQDKFDREAVRLNAFTTLAARRIEDIHVKFRPRSWYCHVPVLSEILTGFANLVVFAGFPGGNGFCSPIRTADIGSVS